LKPSEKVTVTNNGSYTVDEEGNIYNIDGIMIPGLKADENGDVWDSDGNYITNINPFTYEFLSNGVFTFEFVDTAGNKGTATAKVDWIDTVTPEATVEYDIGTSTNKDVTARGSFNEENVTVTNNGGKTDHVFTENGEFIFEFQDAAGNMGTIIAKVDWIDKVAPTAELKYDKQEDKVIVTVVNPSKEIIFKEGNGIYEYTANGNYEIVFYDSLGNVGKLIATIDSFKEENKDDENKPENPSTPNTPDDNKPDDNKPDDSKPVSPDKPSVKPDDETNVNTPNDNTNNSNSSNTNNNNTNNNNSNDNSNNNNTDDDNTTTENQDSDEAEKDKTDKEEQKPNTDNTNKEENNNNNTTVKLEKETKMNKVMLVVITTIIVLLILGAYVIKKIK